MAKVNKAKIKPIFWTIAPPWNFVYLGLYVIADIVVIGVFGLILLLIFKAFKQKTNPIKLLIYSVLLYIGFGIASAYLFIFPMDLLLRLGYWIFWPSHAFVELTGGQSSYGSKW